MGIIRTPQNRGKRGRPPKSDATKPWTIRIPKSVAEPWETILYDPVLGRSKISLRQFIITELMRLLLDAWKSGKSEIPVSHILAKTAQELSDLDSEILSEEDLLGD